MRRAVCILALALAACAVDPDVTLRDDDASVADAAPGQPDTAPGQPDAAPGQPDAAPGQPDAAPGQPDAAPGQPDAAAGQPDASLPRPIGWPVPFSGGEILIPAGALFAFKIHVDAPSALQTWGVIPSDGATAAQVKMALYADAAGTPGDIVSWTGAFAAADETEAATGTPLGAGDYWLALVTDIQMGIRQSSAETVSYCVRSFPFATAFGSTYGTPSNCTTTDSLNIYIVVLEQ